MGKPAVQLVISDQYHANTLQVTQNIERELARIKPDLTKQGIRLYPALFRPANFITTATHDVQSSLLIGGVLVVIVLSLFLFNVRTAVISLIAIPLSLLAAVTVLEYLGHNLNTMTLGGSRSPSACWWTML